MKTIRIISILISLLVAGSITDIYAQNETEQSGTPAQNASDWDDDEPYHALKKGAKIVYTHYDGKGKVQGYNNQEIMEISRTENSVKAVVAGTHTDRKGKVQTSATVALHYNNGNFHVNLLNIMGPKEMKNIDIETEASGSDMLIPEKLTPGQLLPDAEATFQMKIKDGNELFNLPSITFRVFDRKAVCAESVDTPAGKFACFKITQTVEAEYPLIGKQRYTNILWISKGLGTIKTEGYDKKGRLASSMVLTRLE